MTVGSLRNADSVSVASDASPEARSVAQLSATTCVTVRMSAAVSWRKLKYWLVIDTALAIRTAKAASNPAAQTSFFRNGIRAKLAALPSANPLEAYSVPDAFAGFRRAQRSLMH